CLAAQASRHHLVTQQADHPYDTSAALPGGPAIMIDKSTKVDLDAARAAVHTFEASIKGLNLPPETIADLKADIATMKAQLEKADPSHSIVAEAGHSLRKVAEDIGAGVL